MALGALGGAGSMMGGAAAQSGATQLAGSGVQDSAKSMLASVQPIDNQGGGFARLMQDAMSGKFSPESAGNAAFLDLVKQTIEQQFQQNRGGM